MKKHYLIILILLSITALSGIEIEYKGNLSNEIIETTEIDGVEYFNIYNLDKAFNALISYNLISYKVKLDLYNTQLIFTINSQYFQYRTETRNMIHPLKMDDRKILLPKTFLTNSINQIFDKEMHYKDNKLFAEIPVEDAVKKIVIDPGHGGKDPGALGYTNGKYEKHVVLEVSQKIAELLEENLDVQVCLTRDTDDFIALRDRTKFANERKADLFISLHCNSSRYRKAQGAEVYFLSTARTDEERAVEALENSVVEKYEGGQTAMQNYDDLSFILTDMAQTEHLEESSKLAIKLQANIIKLTGAKSRGVKQANFFVLRGAFMPAVLIELGFISNKSEERNLFNKKYQAKLAKAIFEGIKDFKEKYDRIN